MKNKYLKKIVFRIRFRLFKYRYAIRITPYYAGAVSSCLTPREGEDWLRGNDLKDGKLWQLPLVFLDIFKYEFKHGRWKNSNKVKKHL